MDKGAGDALAEGTSDDGQLTHNDDGIAEDAALVTRALHVSTVVGGPAGLLATELHGVLVLVASHDDGELVQAGLLVHAALLVSDACHVVEVVEGVQAGELGLHEASLRKILLPCTPSTANKPNDQNMCILNGYK